MKAAIRVNEKNPLGPYVSELDEILLDTLDQIEELFELAPHTVTVAAIALLRSTKPYELRRLATGERGRKIIAEAIGRYQAHEAECKAMKARKLVPIRGRKKAS
jgi:hypothetical protein